MLTEKIAGLLYIIFGLLLIIFPIFSSAFISLMIGFALVCFGMTALSMGILLSDSNTSTYSYLSMLIGIISILLGILFMFFLNALTVLTSLQFYIAGFIMMVYGLMGIMYLNDKRYTVRSIIILILGILTVVLAVFAATQPVLIAIIIGVALIVEGVYILVIDRSMKLIETYG